MPDAPLDDLDQLVARYLPGVRAFVRLHMGPMLRAVEESCDLTQSVAREVLQHGDRFQGGDEAGFREWLFTTAKRKILHRVEHWQAQKRSGTAGAGLDAVLQSHAAVVPTPSQHATARENLALVEAAFDRLTPEQREVVVQHKLIGRSHAEIAAQMGRTPEAVRALLARAMARLAITLAEPDAGHP